MAVSDQTRIAGKKKYIYITGIFHQKLNGTESQRTPKEVAIELLDTQGFSGSVQWVLLQIS